MARWSRTTRAQYVEAFRRGAQRGRISWLMAALQITQFMSAFLLVKVALSAMRDHLDHQTALGCLDMIAIDITVMVLLLAFLLRRDAVERDRAFLPTVVAGIGAVFVLVLCIPRAY